MLGNYATRGAEEAYIVCQAITGGRPGFWPIAFRLVDLNPTNEGLRHELEPRIEQMGQLTVGPYSDHIRRCLDDVEQAQRSPDISAHVRGWLDDLAARLRRSLEEHRRREVDERVNRG